MPFHHKNIRLRRANYVGQRAYFVTICCLDRTPVFARPSNAEWLVDAPGRYSAAHRFGVGAHCVMPEHVHLLMSGLAPDSDLLAFVKSFKASTTREYLKRQRRPPQRQDGRYKGVAEYVLWQKKFYDRILRPRDNADSVAGYIFMNPVRRGLCKDPREYLYSGSFTTDWKRTIYPVQEWTPEWKHL